jgi:DNA-binding XRE family transcriptional regulator
MTASIDTHHPLRWHRTAKLLSQRDLELAIGNKHGGGGTIHLIETGKSVPAMHVMRRICAALDLDWRDVTEFRASMATKGIQP